MYNSLVVRTLAKIWGVFTLNYEVSLVKRFVDIKTRILGLIFKGSFVKAIFVSENRIIDNSIFYRIYCSLVDFVSNILKSFNSYFKTIGKHSLVLKNTTDLFRGDKEFIKTVLVFALSFGVGIIGINIVKGYFSGSSYLVAISLIIFSIIGLYFRNNYISILNNSSITSFIKGIFTIDEGGDKWW